jgi:hypothetical protein
MAPTWPRPAGASNTGRSASAAGRNAGTSRLDAAHRSTALHDLGPAWLLQARSRLPWRGSSRNAGGVLVARNSSPRIGVRQMREHEDPQPQAAQLAMCRTGRSRSSLPERLRPARQGCEPHRRPTTDCVRACAQQRRTRPFPGCCWGRLGRAATGSWRRRRDPATPDHRRSDQALGGADGGPRQQPWWEPQLAGLRVCVGELNAGGVTASASRARPP